MKILKTKLNEKKFVRDIYRKIFIVIDNNNDNNNSVAVLRG